MCSQCGYCYRCEPGYICSECLDMVERRKRYDKAIDAVCLQLGLKQLDLLEKLGQEHPEYKRFLQEEYRPTLKKVNDYVSGETNEYPLKK